MSWLDRVLGRETDRQQAEIVSLKNEVQRLSEAIPTAYDPDWQLGATQGGSKYFRPLSKSDRDLSPMQFDKAQGLSFYLWENNPFAKRIINLTVDYVLGEGVAVVSKDEDDSLRDAMQKRLNLFWFDSINRMDLKLFDKVRELGIYGEQCWSVHINPVDGHVRLGYIDPAIIVSVITDPRNAEIPQAVKLRTAPGQPDVYYRIIHVDERPGSPSFGRMVGREMIDGQVAEAIYDTDRNAVEPAAITFQGECFYFAVNKVSNAKRGRPDLLAVADWVDGYDQMMFGEVDRALLTKSFVWDVTLTGMDESGVNSYASKQSPPTPGSVRYHNDKVAWEVVSPDLKAADSRVLADLIAAYISTGSELPKTWLNATDDVNRASATELGEPAFKFLTARQRQVRYILDQVINFVLDQAELHGALPKRPNEPGVRRPIPWAYACQFPELRPKDLAGLSATFNQSMDALTKARAEMLIDQETAQEMTAMLVSLFGVEVDLEAMRERLEQEQQEKDDQAALLPYGMGPGQPGEADGQEPGTEPVEQRGVAPLSGNRGE